MKIINTIGARLNFVKITPIIMAYDSSSDNPYKITML